MKRILQTAILAKIHLKTTLLTEVRGGVFPEVPINTLDNVPYPLPTDTATPYLR